MSENNTTAEVIVNDPAPTEVATPEAPRDANNGKPAKAKAAKGKAKPVLKDNGFRVLQTVNVAPARIHFSEYTGRTVPVEHEALTALADSIREHGQLQAIQVTEMSTPRGIEYECVFGHTRKRAFDLLVSGYTSGDSKEISPHPDATIRCEVVSIEDDKAAFIAKVAENEQRSDTNPMDKAKNHQIMRDEFGMSGVAIARVCGYKDSTNVSKLQFLLTLSEEHQQHVKDGSIGQAAACEWANAKKVPVDDRDAVWGIAVGFAEADGADAVGLTHLSKAITKLKADRKAEATPVESTAPTGDNEDATDNVEPHETGSAAPKLAAVSIKELRAAFEGIGKDQYAPARMAEFANLMLGFIGRETTEVELRQWLINNLS